MTMLRGIYNEIMADLMSKGFGGYVQLVDHDYENDIRTNPTPYRSTYTQPQKTKNETSLEAISKNKNARPDVGSVRPSSFNVGGIN
jgi:hypothetical protein